MTDLKYILDDAGDADPDPPSTHISDIAEDHSSSHRSSRRHRSSSSTPHSSHSSHSTPLTLLGSQRHHHRSSSSRANNSNSTSSRATSNAGSNTASSSRSAAATGSSSHHHHNNGSSSSRTSRAPASTLPPIPSSSPLTSPLSFEPSGSSASTHISGSSSSRRRTPRTPAATTPPGIDLVMDPSGYGAPPPPHHHVYSGGDERDRDRERDHDRDRHRRRGAPPPPPAPSLSPYTSMSPGATMAPSTAEAATMAMGPGGMGYVAAGPGVLSNSTAYGANMMHGYESYNLEAEASAIALNYPQAIAPGMAPGSSAAASVASNVRATTAEEVRLTPVTGRPSKAKKGIPVHKCEICSPPRVFTRAEHLRRHQLSHQPPAFVCQHPGCGQEFYRADLLNRHQRRHRNTDDFQDGEAGFSNRRGSTQSTGSNTGGWNNMVAGGSPYPYQPHGPGNAGAGIDENGRGGSSDSGHRRQSSSGGRRGGGQQQQHHQQHPDHQQQYQHQYRYSSGPGPSRGDYMNNKGRADEYVVISGMTTSTAATDVTDARDRPDQRNNHNSGGGDGGQGGSQGGGGRPWSYDPRHIPRTVAPLNVYMARDDGFGSMVAVDREVQSAQNVQSVQNAQNASVDMETSSPDDLSLRQHTYPPPQPPHIVCPTPAWSPYVTSTTVSPSSIPSPAQQQPFSPFAHHPKSQAHGLAAITVGTGTGGGGGGGGGGTCYYGDHFHDGSTSYYYSPRGSYVGQPMSAGGPRVMQHHSHSRSGSTASTLAWTPGTEVEFGGGCAADVTGASLLLTAPYAPILTDGPGSLSTLSEVTHPLDTSETYYFSPQRSAISTANFVMQVADPATAVPSSSCASAASAVSAATAASATLQGALALSTTACSESALRHITSNGSMSSTASLSSSTSSTVSSMGPPSPIAASPVVVTRPSTGNTSTLAAAPPMSTPVMPSLLSRRRGRHGNWTKTPPVTGTSTAGGAISKGHLRRRSSSANMQKLRRTNSVVTIAEEMVTPTAATPHTAPMLMTSSTTSPTRRGTSHSTDDYWTSFASPFAPQGAAIQSHVKHEADQNNQNNQDDEAGSQTSSRRQSVDTSSSSTVTQASVAKKNQSSDSKAKTKGEQEQEHTE